MSNHISIESTDDVGKTTVATILAEKLNYEFIEKPIHKLTSNQNAMEIYLDMTSKINSIEDKYLRAMFYDFGNLLLKEIAGDKSIVTDRHILSNLC